MPVKELTKPTVTKKSPAVSNPVLPKQAERKRPKRGVMNKDLGKRGEDAAYRYLYRRGYDVIERNWKCKFGEADLIAKDGETIVFVEVKTRSDLEHGFPGDAVDKEKRERYEKIALTYLRDCADDDVDIRFDVVAIVATGDGRALIRHHINAFSMENVR